MISIFLFSEYKIVEGYLSLKQNYTWANMGNFTGFGQLVSDLEVKRRLIFVLTYVLGLMYHIVTSWWWQRMVWDTHIGNICSMDAFQRHGASIYQVNELEPENGHSTFLF